MAKTAKLKKSSKAPSLHSRASKRLTSPTIDLDIFLTSLKAPAQSSNQRPSVLAVHHGAGISKKKAKGKALSRAQKKRQERGLERAEMVMDKTEKKVERGMGKRKGERERKVGWEELNGRIREVQGTELGSSLRKKEEKKNEEKENEEADWEDESMEGKDEGGEEVTDVPEKVADAEVAEGEKPPDQAGGEDEIL